MEGLKLRSLWSEVVAFAPNRDTLGAIAYFIVENAGNILIDCPPWNPAIQEFLQSQGVRWLFVTHRGALSKSIGAIQQALNCQVIIQEQEAYLLPELQATSFERELILGDTYRLLWTPGHSPGSACLYWPGHKGVLFSGRHLLLDRQGDPRPVRTAKTFHWYRQLESVKRLKEYFSPATLNFLCSGAGASSGEFLYCDRAWERLGALDLETLRQVSLPQF
ncbi:MAG: MBL fold metallo-hydrolase [Chloroflexaceae bacterium]|nr:MBL fold metallo-hydrolase [Chloroflexaceae bacterium]